MADAEYGMVMPFIVVVSKGGPFDDKAFVAGWRCGEVDRYLHACEHTNAKLAFSVEPEVIPQLDLIAMHRGYEMNAQEEEGGWVNVHFQKASGDADGDAT